MGTRTARGNRGHGAVRQVRRLAGLVHSVAAPAFKVGPAAESPTRFSARLSGTTQIRPERRNLILATRIRGPRAWDRGIPERADVAERSRDEPDGRSEEHTSELQSRLHLVCRLLLEKKKKQPERVCRADAISDASSPSV